MAEPDPPAPGPMGDPPRPRAPIPTDVSPVLRAFGATTRALTPRGFVTEALVAINVLVFVIMVARGVSPMEPKVLDLLDWGAGYGPRTAGGQWWRLFTATFLHIGVIHLGMNMYVLWDAGRLVERIFGNAGFLVLYVSAGLAGSIASVAWHPFTVSAGASGAVFGVYGGLLGFLVMERRSLPREVLQSFQRSAMVFVGLNLMIGLGAKGIDLAAHVGGFVGGFAGGLVLSHPLDAAGASRRGMRAAFLAAGTAIAVLTATRLLPPRTDVEAELTSFRAVEKRSMDGLREAFEASKDGKLTDAQFAERIETQILPPWQASHRKLAAAQGVPTEEQRYLDALLVYMSAREDAFSLLAEGARTDDAAVIQRGQEKLHEANELVKKLNEQQR